MVDTRVQETCRRREAVLKENKLLVVRGILSRIECRKRRRIQAFRSEIDRLKPNSGSRVHGNLEDRRAFTEVVEDVGKRKVHDFKALGILNRGRKRNGKVRRILTQITIL